METSNKENQAAATGTGGALAMQANNTIGFAESKMSTTGRTVT